MEWDDARLGRLRSAALRCRRQGRRLGLGADEAPHLRVEGRLKPSHRKGLAFVDVDSALSLSAVGFFPRRRRARPDKRRPAAKLRIVSDGRGVWGLTWALHPQRHPPPGHHYKRRRRSRPSAWRRHAGLPHCDAPSRARQAPGRAPADPRSACPLHSALARSLLPLSLLSHPVLSRVEVLVRP